MCRILAAIILAAGLSSGSAAKGESTVLKPSIVYVAVDGNDEWSGRLARPNAGGTDGPKATIASACAQLQKQGAGESKVIRVEPGEYYVDKTIVLAGGPVEISGDGKNKPILYGGQRVTNWVKDGEKFYSAALEGVKEGKWDFRCLIVNGRYCPRARYPEKGTLTHESVFDVPWMSSTGGGWKRKPTDTELTTLKYKKGDLGAWLNIANAEITVYHMWDDSMVGIKSIDTESRTLTFSSKTGHPPGAFGVKKYVIWNIRQGMTRPGQWYLDRSAGKVVYWPLAGEDMATAHVIAPTLETIIRVRSNDVNLSNLKLSVTTTPLKAGGFGAGAFAGALSISSVNGCRVNGLEVFNVGGQGIDAGGNSIEIRGCDIHDIGACGVKFGGSNSSITDNRVFSVGLTYPSAIGIRGGGQNNKIEYNEVHDTTYTAINWGGTKNSISHNHIYRAMLELHDGGGIYCFAGKDLILEGNFIHDIPDTGGYGSSSYYLDERSQDCIVRDNLSLRVARPSHNHMAKHNSIIGNVFVTDGDMRLTFPRSENFTFERNILISGGKITFQNGAAVTRMFKNVLFSRQGDVVDDRLKDYSKIDTVKLEPGQDNFEVDPKLTVGDDGRITAADDSPLAKLGLSFGDFSKAGPRR